jgi:hypothetical protein
MTRSAIRTPAYTQAEKRRGIDVGGLFSQVTAVGTWYKAGHFASEEAARGAFELAYQQGLDGMGQSIQEWMGLTEAEYDEWMRSQALPSR